MGVNARAGIALSAAMLFLGADQAAGVVVVAGQTGIETGFFDQLVQLIVHKAMDITIFVDQFSQAARVVVAVFEHAAARVDALERLSIAVEYIAGAVAEWINASDQAPQCVVLKALAAFGLFNGRALAGRKVLVHPPGAGGIGRTQQAALLVVTEVR